MAETNGKHNNPDELPENERPRTGTDETVDLGAEFAALARKFGEAMQELWGSEERQNIEREIRAGVRRLSDDLEESLKKARESEAAHKVEERARQMREDIQSGKVSEDVRRGIASALRTISDELDKISGSEDKSDSPKV